MVKITVGINGMACGMWFFNHIEIPVLRTVLRKGDVHVYTKDDIQRLCRASGLKLERTEEQDGSAISK